MISNFIPVDIYNISENEFFFIFPIQQRRGTKRAKWETVTMPSDISVWA